MSMRGMDWEELHSQELEDDRICKAECGYSYRPEFSRSVSRQSRQLTAYKKKTRRKRESKAKCSALQVFDDAKQRKELKALGSLDPTRAKKKTRRRKKARKGKGALRRKQAEAALASTLP